MIPFPLALEPTYGKLIAYLVFLVIGFSFGYVLESSGFNKSTLLAAQFYFKDLRVFKVFFTAIVVAMLMIFSAGAMGLLDYNLIWVNPTYLWSGIVGGLIMGVGFIMGGFCPGTSMCAVAIGKIDAMVFTAGMFVGILFFSEAFSLFEGIYYGDYLGPVRIYDFLGLTPGVFAVLLIIVSLVAFIGARIIQNKVKKVDY